MKTPIEIITEQMEIINKGLAPKKRQTFEEFLEDKHSDGYNGTDDNMPDAYDHWCSELDVQKVMDFAQIWGDTLV